jgi:hypothetical protein
MRAFLVATALLSADASECTTEHYSVLSQRRKGKGVMKQHVEANGQPAMEIVMKYNISSSFDVDEFNLVECVEASLYANDQTIPVKTEQITIVNWKQGFVAQQTTPPGQDPTCKVMKLPTFMASMNFIKWFKTVSTEAMDKAYNCKGSADGMDTYTLDFPPSWLPVPSPVEVHSTIEVDDQDHLIHKETVKEDIDMKGRKVHAEATFVVEENRAGGPTADELVVPDSWGSCEEHVLDIEEMLKPADARTMRAAVGEFRKILRAVHSISELAKHSEVVV